MLNLARYVRNKDDIREQELISGEHVNRFFHLKGLSYGFTSLPILEVSDNIEEKVSV